jgi:hypothetical protein
MAREKAALSAADFGPCPRRSLTGTRIIHTALAGAGTMLLLCKQREKNAALETA